MGPAPSRGVTMLLRVADGNAVGYPGAG